MIFSSIDYVIFFIVCLCAFAVIPGRDPKKLFLLAASYFFYAYWDWHFVILMLGLSVANFYFGMKIHTSEGRERRNALIASLVVNLGTLAYFKYTNFFLGNIQWAFGLSENTLKIILPVGISFIVFEVVAYTVDIYRRQLEPTEKFVDLALLISFFPHLIAGPILKPKHFLPQLERPIKIESKNLWLGLQIFALGFAKKTMVADRCAIVSDEIFANPAHYGPLATWFGVLCYTLQIYGDFSGYTDMAIGSAKMLGFDIPKNFNFPYLARNVTDFWRRWHISLSTWLRDYLYISLGGNRRGKGRQYVNLMTVMLFGGLWHGASWTFVIWGGIHGIGLAVHKAFSDLTGNKSNNALVPKVLSWALTLVFVMVGWVFFRATTFSGAVEIVGKMFGFGGTSGVAWYPTALFIAIPALILADWCMFKLDQGKQLNPKNFWHLMLLFLGLWLIFILYPAASAPFIYFQF